MVGLSRFFAETCNLHIEDLGPKDGRNEQSSCQTIHLWLPCKLLASVDLRIPGSERDYIMKGGMYDRETTEGNHEPWKKRGYN